jgi:hypothetical protein
MRRIFPVALLILIGISGLSVIQPGAEAAYTWDEIANFELGDSTEAQHGTDGDYGAAIPMGDSFLSMAIVGNDAANTQSHVVYKCTLTSCPSNSAIGISSTSGTAGGRISKLSDTTAYGCVAASPSNAIGVSKTTNAGALWATVSFSATTASNCDVATFDGSHYAVVWMNTTSDDWVVSMSSDGGSTFPVTYLVSADATNQDETGGVAVAAFSDTDYVALVWDSDTGNFNQCKTTNSGVTWTCVASVITGAKTIMKEKLGTSYYFSWTPRLTGDFAGFGTIASVNDNIAGTNAYSVSDANTAVCTSDVAVFDADRAAVAFVLCTTGGSQVLKIAETFDGGANWEVSNVDTIPCALSSFPQNANAGIAYSPEGRLFTAFQFYFADDSACVGSDGDAIVERLYVAYVSGATVAVPVGAAASATLTGTFQGGHVDDNGTVVIVRSNAGEVRTYSGISLGTALASDTTDVCNQVDGVFSTGNLVAYLVCEVDGNKDGLRIRTSALGVPTSSDFNGCAPGDSAGQCQTTIGMSGDESFSENGDDCQGEIAEVSAFPISYASQSDISGFNPRHVAWAWSSFIGSECTGSAGYVGVNMFTQQGGGLETDDRNSIESQFAGTVAEQICTGVDDDQFYIGAAGTDAVTKTFPVTFSITGANEELQGSFGTASNMPSLYGQADSIACADSKVGIRNAGFVAVCSRTGTGCVSTTVSDDSNTRAVALSKTLSGNRQYVSYLNGGDYKVAFASNMTAICDLDTTGISGTHKNMKFTSLGPSVFLFTTTNIYRFELGGTCANEDFTIPAEGSEGEDPIPTITPTGTLPAQNPDNILGQHVVAASTAWGFDVAALFGMVIVLGITIKASQASNGAVIIVSIAGLIGIIICVQLGLFAEWVIYAVVFLIILAAGGVIFANRRAGAGGET